MLLGFGKGTVCSLTETLRKAFHVSFPREAFINNAVQAPAEANGVGAFCARGKAKERIEKRGAETQGLDKVHCPQGTAETALREGEEVCP